MIVCFCFVWGFIRDKLLRISVCVEWNSLSMDWSYSEKLFHALDKIKKHQVCNRLHVGFRFRFSRNLSCYTNQLYFLYTHQGKNLQRAEFYAVFSVDKQWANNRCLCFCVMQGKVHLELRLSEVITDSGVISHKLATRWGHSYTQTRKHAKMLGFNVHFLPALPYHLSLFHYGANRRWQRHFFCTWPFVVWKCDCIHMWLVNLSDE